MPAILIRTFLIYIILTLSLRILGKRQIGELEISELVSTLLLSELASIPIDDPNLPLSFSLIPIFLIVALEFLVSDLKNRTPFLKRLFEGKPSVLIRKGKLDQKEMRRMRISVEELLSAFRLQGVSNFHDVYYAILEQNGQLSVLLRKEKMPPTAEDMGRAVSEEGMAHAIVVDGAVNDKELALCGKNEAWLKNLCAAYGTASKDVFLLTLTDGGDVTLIPRKEYKT